MRYVILMFVLIGCAAPLDAPPDTPMAGAQAEPVAVEMPRLYLERIDQPYEYIHARAVLVYVWKDHMGLELSDECVRRVATAPAMFLGDGDFAKRCGMDSLACTAHAGDDNAEILIRYDRPRPVDEFIHELGHVAEMCEGDSYQDGRSVNHERPEIWGPDGVVELAEGVI